MKLFSEKKNRERGFSLISALLVIFICSMALVAILSLLSSSLNLASHNKDRLIAAALAQEGMEIVRYIRESEVDWTDWYNSFPAGTEETGRVQYDRDDFLADSAVPFKIDSEGFYQYYNGQNSVFYRKVRLTKLSNDELKVVVEVNWQTGAKPHILKIEDRLWKWR